jgi:hypothetical protein
MSTVIAFERSRRSTPPMPPPRPHGTAQVLLFTGVRYERLEVAETPVGQFATTQRP